MILNFKQIVRLLTAHARYNKGGIIIPDKCDDVVKDNDKTLHYLIQDVRDAWKKLDAYVLARVECPTIVLENKK